MYRVEWLVRLGSPHGESKIPIADVVPVFG